MFGKEESRPDPRRFLVSSQIEAPADLQSQPLPEAEFPAWDELAAIRLALVRR